TTTLLHPGIFANLSAEFSLDRGLKPLPIAYCLLPLPTTRVIQQTLLIPNPDEVQPQARSPTSSRHRGSVCVLHYT
ncbi:hypothetical protein, partial [Coleofasciculus sp. B1-GNL1-01]|uniref:hypothetical protein n=1 Tax=Coleofasciculus sp. B1-GNL1-01 TaxID=3068484 RepID=UPI004063D9F6